MYFLIFPVEEMKREKDGRKKDAYYDFIGLRLGIFLNFFSVPPSIARRLLLSRAINASRPSFTNDVFSLMPVKREAFSKI